MQKDIEIEYILQAILIFKMHIYHGAKSNKSS